MTAPTFVRILQFGLMGFTLGTRAAAQTLPHCLATDTSGDTIWLLKDLDLDGTFNGAGEATSFYDDVTGAIPLTNNAGFIRDDSGAVWVSDTSEDVILRLADQNGDGDALDAGEALIWFDGTSGNPSGIELTSGRGLWRDSDGVLWVASANTGGGGVDAIVRLEDLNGDGDANDAGEQLEYFTPGLGGATGDSIPTAVARGADGALYYVETGATGVLNKGVWRLEDLDGSGTIDQPGEATEFFVSVAGSGTPFHWDLSIDSAGQFYMDDTGNDVIWQFADTNGDGVIDHTTEARAVYTATANSLIWESSPFSDGALYVAEDQNPDRLLRMEDLDGDGLFDTAGEVTTIYDETVAVINFGSPKGVIPFTPVPTTIGTTECLVAVPNSTGVTGEIRAYGSTSLALNDISLQISNLPQNAFGFFIASTDAGLTMNPGGSDGVLCLGGAIGRYVGADIFSTGLSGEAALMIDLTALPQPTGVIGAASGETWRFQAWHRDANPMPTSNFTGAVAITLVN